MGTFCSQLKLGTDSQGKQHGHAGQRASTAGKQQIVIFEHTRIPDSALASNVLLKGFLGHIRHQIESPKRDTKKSAQGWLPQSDFLPQ
jgi:hypothetical protein